MLRSKFRSIVVSSAGLFVALSQTQAHEVKLNNSYVAQENNRYCGPATIQMILNNRPAPNTDPLPSQDAIKTRIKASNSAWNVYNPGDTYNSADPDGIRGALNHFDNPPRNYISYVQNTRDAANRKLAYNINTFNVPAAALLNGGLHWVNVRGFDSSAAPTAAGAYDINGFYIRDPWSGFSNDGNGLGKNRYLANNADGWHKYFVPSAAQWEGPWDNKYCVVADPLETGDMDTVPDPSPSGPEISAAQAAARAVSELADLPALAAEYAFQFGAFDSDDALRLSWFDDEAGDADWLVPFYKTGGELSGAMLIDALTGDITQALWGELGDTPTITALQSQLLDEYAGRFPEGQANVPEPQTLALLVAGSLMLRVRSRRAA
jgi:Peptidase_C39 like family